MRDEHPSDDALDDYVGDGLDAAARRELEDHLRTCEACGARLARAAEAELVLLTLGREPRPRRRVGWRPIAVGGAVAAMAAAVALVVVLRDRAPAPAPSLATPSEPVAVEPVLDEVAFADDAEQLELPSSAELVGFVPEAEP